MNLPTIQCYLICSTEQMMLINKEVVILFFLPNFSNSFLRAACGSVTVTLRWPWRCRTLAHRLPMIPAPRIKILEPTEMGAIRSQPWDTHDRGSVRAAANNTFVCRCDFVCIYKFSLVTYSQTLPCSSVMLSGSLWTCSAATLQYWAQPPLLHIPTVLLIPPILQ